MGDTIKQFLAQSRGVKIFFYVTGGAFTALTLYALYLNVTAGYEVKQAILGIPADLKQMTLAAWGIIAMGIKEGLGKLESVTNIDLDGNGTVGTVTKILDGAFNSSESPNTSIVNQVATQSQETVAQASVPVADPAPTIYGP